MLLFADDLCLMAPTRKGLDKMIQLCAMYCKKYGLSFNASKSKIVVFSKAEVDTHSLCPIYLNGSVIEYVDSITYLGATITNKKGGLAHIWEIAKCNSTDVKQWLLKTPTCLMVK